MKVSAKITGFKQLKLAAVDLQSQIERGAMRDALTKAARLITAAIRRNAPKGATGLLKKSIRQKVVTSARGNVRAYIGPSNNVSGQADLLGNGHIVTVRPVKYAHLVEFGTKSRGSYGRKGEKVTPGNAPRPFMRPAYEQTKAATVIAYKDGLVPGIERAARKIKKRTLKSLT